MMLKKTAVLFCLFSCFYGCGNIKNEEPILGDEPIVEVKGEFLYRTDINNILPKDLGKEDSISYIDNYVKKWAVRILMYDKANKNINDDDEIEKLVSDYRRSLIIHRYQQKLIDQKIKDPSENEMKEYYNSNLEKFKLKEDLVMGLYMKIPKNATKIDNLVDWINNQNSKNLQKIEKYSYQNAVNYEYFGDHWISLNELIASTPIQQENRDELLSKKLIEKDDDAFKYILHINTYRKVGSTEPYDFAKDKIKIILMNVNKTNYINKFEDELYEKAKKRGTIKMYNK